MVLDQYTLNDVRIHICAMSALRPQGFRQRATAAAHITTMYRARQPTPYRRLGDWTDMIGRTVHAQLQEL